MFSDHMDASEVEDYEWYYTTSDIWKFSPSHTSL